MPNPAQPGQFAYFMPGGQPALDELGIWQSLPRQAGETSDSFSFSGAAESQPDPAGDLNLFQVNLPPGIGSAGQALTMQELRLERSTQGITAAARRLEHFASQGGLPAEVSFALPGTQAVSGLAPELELQSWLDATTPAESFAGLPGLPSLPANWKDVANEAAAFFTKVRQLITVGDVIESKQDGRRIGLTAISLNGDFSSFFGANQGGKNAKLHAQVLRQAIATRAAWLNLSASIISGAARLAILFPTSPWLAIPAAYQFFRKVLQQVQDWPTSQTQA